MHVFLQSIDGIRNEPMVKTGARYAYRLFEVDHKPLRLLAAYRGGLATLVGRLHNIRLEQSLTEAPTAYEFRQPRKLTVSWDPRD